MKERGRPTTDWTRKTKRYSIRLSDIDRQKLEVLMLKSGKTMSEVLREILNDAFMHAFDD
ncbi:MAG: hypothetical protein ACI4UK_09610 [Floccifex sp.]